MKRVKEERTQDNPFCRIAGGHGACPPLLQKRNETQRTAVVLAKARVCQEMPTLSGSKCYFDKVFALSEDDVQPCDCFSNQW